MLWALYEKQHPFFGEAKLKRWCFIYGCRKTEMEQIWHEWETLSWTYKERGRSKWYFVCAERILFLISHFIWLRVNTFNWTGATVETRFPFRHHNELLRPKVSARGGWEMEKICSGEILNKASNLFLTDGGTTEHINLFLNGEKVSTISVS